MTFRCSPSIHYDPLNLELYMSSAPTLADLVSANADLVCANNEEAPDEEAPVRLLYLGAGTGVWGLVFAEEHFSRSPSNALHLTFTEVLQEGVDLCNLNAVTFQAKNPTFKFTFSSHLSDMFAGLPPETNPFNLILFNPPQTSGPETFKSSRPDKYGGGDGTLFYERLASESCPGTLSDGGILCVAHIGFVDYGKLHGLLTEQVKGGGELGGGRTEGRGAVLLGEQSRTFDAVDYPPGVMERQLENRAKGKAVFEYDEGSGKGKMVQRITAFVPGRGNGLK